MKKKTNGHGIKIEKKVKLPPNGRHTNRGRTPVYPFALMEKGDSFAVPIAKKDRIRAAATMTRHGKFVTRVMGDLIRCWRVG